jgi:hypothetical protein
MKEGPWSYRLISVAIIMPMYSLILMCIGTLRSLCCLHDVVFATAAMLASPPPNNSDHLWQARLLQEGGYADVGAIPSQQVDEDHRGQEVSPLLFPSLSPFRSKL